MTLKFTSDLRHAVRDALPYTSAAQQVEVMRAVLKDTYEPVDTKVFKSQKWLGVTGRALLGPGTQLVPCATVANQHPITPS